MDKVQKNNFTQYNYYYFNISECMHIWWHDLWEWTSMTAMARVWYLNTAIWIVAWNLTLGSFTKISQHIPILVITGHDRYFTFISVCRSDWVWNSQVRNPQLAAQQCGKSLMDSSVMASSSNQTGSRHPTHA
jgi:hypothetical protein